MELRAALADDDRAGGDGLAAVRLDAAVLRIRVAAVLGRALSLLVCHGLLSPALAVSDQPLIDSIWII